MAGKIFINYRRDDDPGSTGRLFDKLELHFPRDRLFFDVDSIPPGVDFVEYLDEQVGQCDVLLAVVGKTWLDAADDNGARRLESSDDFVRIEIESAIKRGIRVIPVLMNRAEMPGEERLPDSLKPFARRNAVRLNHDRFKADCDGLIASIGKALDLAEEARKDAERRKAAQRDMLDTQEAGRADALASWAAIKDSTNPQDFMAHLARHPQGPTERMARERVKTLQWTSGALPEIVALSVLPFGLLVATVFIATGWGTPTGANDRTEIGTSLLVSVPVMLVLLGVLVYRRLGRLLPSEVANYWLAFILTLPGLLMIFAVGAGPIFGVVVIAVAVLIPVSAALLIWRYRRRLSGAAVTAYWIGCSLPAVAAIATLIEMLGFKVWDGVQGEAMTGLIVATVAVIISAVVLSVRRRPIGPVEASGYWLGCMLLLTATLGSCAYTMKPYKYVTDPTDPFYFGAGAAVALALGLIAAVVLVYPYRKAPPAGALRRYWTGFMFALVLALGNILAGSGSSFPVGAFLGFGLALILALAMWGWHTKLNAQARN